MNNKSTDLLTIGILSIAMIIWASSFIAMKIAVTDMGAMSVIFFRMLIASCCFIFFIKRFTKIKFTKKDLKYLILLGLFEPCLYFIFESYALKYTTAGQAGMIASMMPLITAVAAGVILKEIISKQLVLGSLLAIVGAIWLSMDSTSSANAPDPMFGNFLELLAMACGAGYTIVARYLSNNYTALFITAAQAFLGAIFFLPLATYEYFTIGFNFSYDALVAITYLGVVVTIGGYGLYNLALTRTDASIAAMYVNLIPIFALIIAYLVLNETLTTFQFYASALILFGVVITQLPKKFTLGLLRNKNS